MTEFVSPKGRLVQGSPFVGQTHDYEGKPFVDEEGKPYVEYQITVAYPKGDPTSEAFIMSLGNDCVKFWPAQFPQGMTAGAPTFGAIHPRFSSKVIDGDGRDGNGQPNAAKEGMAGHWCVKYVSRFAPGVYELGKYDPLENLQNDPAKHSLLRRGFYIRVAGKTDTNYSDQTPGIKVYPNLIEIVHAGPEIVSGPDARAVFGAAPVSGAPVTAAPLPAAPYVAPVASIPAASTPAVPATPSPSSPAPAPYSGYIPTPPVPAAPVRVMLPAAGGATYEAMIAAGWTDEMLRAHGMMR